MRQKLILALLGVELVGACASGAAAQPKLGGMVELPARDKLEAVYAVQAGKQTVRVRVSSNGCTKKDDFLARLAESGPPPVILLIRRKPDQCRSFAMGSAWLDFSYAELGVERARSFSLANPLTAWTGPGD